MILYYVRHGDPIYDPDSLTELGHKQAAALAKRFALYGLDEIYASTSMRAKQTAEPTCKLLKKEAELLEWANEGLAWQEFTVTQSDGGRCWAFHSREFREKAVLPKVCLLGEKWYTYPDFAKEKFQAGVERVNREADGFLRKLGFEHDREKNCYKVLKRSCDRKNPKRVALFAHQGFGLAFLSSILDIPYPLFCNRFDLGHSSVTVIDFDDTGERAYPKVWQLSNDSHLYKEEILTGYQNGVDI